METGFLNHFHMAPVYTCRWKSGGEFSLLLANLQVPVSVEACLCWSKGFPLDLSDYWFQIQDRLSHAVFSSVLISGLYCPKYIHDHVFRSNILSTLLIYYLVDNILNLLRKISPFPFSYSCANSMEQGYKSPPCYSSCMPCRVDITKWLVGFL